MHTWLLLQSAVVLHATHCPALVPEGSPQTVPPFAVHAPATGVRTGMPIEQESATQGFMSSGTSVSSAIVVVPPFPSHTTSMQSPGVWLAVGVMAATSTVPQQRWSQVVSTHSFWVGGQSVIAMQEGMLDGQAPNAPPAPPAPPVDVVAAPPLPPDPGLVSLPPQLAAFAASAPAATATIAKRPVLRVMHRVYQSCAVAGIRTRYAPGLSGASQRVRRYAAKRSAIASLGCPKAAAS